MRRPAIGLILTLALTSGGMSAQEVGSQLKPEVEFDAVVGLPITSIDNLVGRAVLVEFFAHW